MTLRKINIILSGVLIFVSMSSLGQDTLKNGTVEYRFKYGRYIFNYRNDTLNGPYLIYNHQDKLRVVGTFSNGYRHGTQLCYNDSGLVNEKKFNRGKIEFINFYSPNGDNYLRDVYNDNFLEYSIDNFSGEPQKSGPNKGRRVHNEGFIKSYTDIKSW